MPAVALEQGPGTPLCRQKAPVTGVHRETTTYQPIQKSFDILTMRQPYQCILLRVSTAQTHRWKIQVWPLTLPLFIQVASISILPNGQPRKLCPCRFLAGNMAAQAKGHFYKDTPSLSARIPWKPQSFPQATAVGTQALGSWHGISYASFDFSNQNMQNLKQRGKLQIHLRESKEEDKSRETWQGLYLRRNRTFSFSLSEWTL